MAGKMVGGEDMGRVGQENGGCSQMPELSLRRPERVGWKKKSPRKLQVEEMAGGEGDHIGKEEENKHTDQFHSHSTPTKALRPKKGRGRPRKIKVVQDLMHEEQGEGENAGNNDDEGCSQMPELSLRVGWKRKSPRKQQVEEMAGEGEGEGNRVGGEEEYERTEQFDSHLTTTKVLPLKRGRGRPRKIQVVPGSMHEEQGEGENAGNNEEILLNQGLLQLAKTSMELVPSCERPREGKEVTESREEEEVRQPKTGLPMTLSESTYVHAGLTTFEPSYDWAKNSWDFTLSQRVYGSAVFRASYENSSKNLGLEWYGNSKLNFSFKGISSPQVAIALESRRMTRSLKAYLDQCPVRSALLDSPVQNGISAAEIAFASEPRCLAQNMKAYLDRCGVRATPLKSPVRNVMTTATDKQDHSATMCDIPAAVSSSNHIKNQGLSFSPTSLMYPNLHTTALPNEADNQNVSVLTKLGDQSMSANHGLLDTTEQAADLLTQNHGSGDLCQANPSGLELIDNHQPAEEAHMPSIVIINTDKETANKSKQSGAYPSRSVSPNLTQMCLLMDDNLADFDEVGSRLDEALVSVNGYEVKAEVAHILGDIFFRHGDIAKDCTFRAVKSRSCLLENVCGIYKRMEGANFMLITPIELNSLLEEVRDLETAKIELGWLHCRLVEILEAKKCFKSLKEEKRRITEATERGKQVLEGHKNELEALMKKIHEEENALTVLEVEEEKLHEKFNHMKYNLKGFYRKSLVHGLL